MPKPSTNSFFNYVKFCLHTPKFFALVRVYKILKLKNFTKNKHYVLNVIVGSLVFLFKLPINMLRIVMYMYRIYVLFRYEFDVFDEKYQQLEDSYFN